VQAARPGHIVLLVPVVSQASDIGTFPFEATMLVLTLDQLIKAVFSRSHNLAYVTYTVWRHVAQCM